MGSYCDGRDCAYRSFAEGEEAEVGVVRLGVYVESGNRKKAETEDGMGRDRYRLMKGGKKTEGMV